METVRVSTKGQVVIPKEIRDHAHIEPGTELAVTFVAGQIRFTPVPVVPASTHGETAGCLHKPDREPMDEVRITTAIGARLKARDEATKS